MSQPVRRDNIGEMISCPSGTLSFRLVHGDRHIRHIGSHNAVAGVPGEALWGNGVQAAWKPAVIARAIIRRLLLRFLLLTRCRPLMGDETLGIHLWITVEVAAGRAIPAIPNPRE